MSAQPRGAIGPREFIVLIAFLQALQALAIDAMLPALGTIAADLGATEGTTRQYIISAFIFGAGLGSLLPGILSDRYGRRPVLFGCLIAYSLLNLACALATSMFMLIFLRCLTGFCTAGMGVLPAAMIRDRFEGDAMARLQSLVSMIFMIVPVLAPSLGQAVLLFASWHWIFGMMATMSAILLVWSYLRLEESLKPGDSQPMTFGQIGQNIGEVITQRESIGYVLAMSSTMAMFVSFLSTSQQIIGEHFGAGLRFPMIFGMMAACMSVASFTNSRLVMRFGARRVSHTALLAYIAVAAMQVVAAFSPDETLWQFVTLMAMNMFLSSFISANFSSIALQPFGHIAGSAASVMAFLRMVIASLMGMLVGMAFDGTARPLAVTILVAGLISLSLVLFSERGRLFRRLNYPPANV